MPMYDRGCPQCGEQLIDCYEPVEAPKVLCPDCRVPTKRIWIGRGAAVIPDEIPGGYVMEHVEPGRKVYSNSELRAVLASHGYRQHVEHMPDHKGTDKSKHTTRWI